MEQIVFCHGAPGSARDAALLQGAQDRITAPEIFAQGDDPLAALAQRRCRRGETHPCRVFSGAMLALKLAAERSSDIERLVPIVDGGEHYSTLKQARI